MYQKGDLIIYGEHGVCRVADIGIPHISGTKIDEPYYTLAPLYTDGLIYIPVSTKVFMRPIISKAEAERLIRRLPGIQEAVIRNSSMVTLRQRYDDYLKSHDCETLFQLIKGIYQKEQHDKKLGQTDRLYMKQAEKILYGELASALGIPMGEVVPYIERALN